MSTKNHTQTHDSPISRECTQSSVVSAITSRFLLENLVSLKAGMTHAGACSVIHKHQVMKRERYTKTYRFTRNSKNLSGFT